MIASLLPWFGTGIVRPTVNSCLAEFETVPSGGMFSTYPRSPCAPIKMSTPFLFIETAFRLRLALGVLQPLILALTLIPHRYVIGPMLALHTASGVGPPGRGIQSRVHLVIQSKLEPHFGEDARATDRKAVVERGDPAMPHKLTRAHETALEAG